VNAVADTKSLFEKYVLPTYGRFDLVIESGRGCRVRAENGREYLDFGAGIAVCSLGHAHPRVTAAISAQAARLVHTSNLYFTRPQAELAERLVRIVGEPGKVFFCNSGAEANEGLYKLARRFGSELGRYEVLTFEGSFHGRTLAGISATGQEKVKKGFGPLPDGFRHVPYGDIAAVRAAISERTAAILVEPVLGEAGIHVARAEFLQALRAVCDEDGLLLLFDEVQCGLGRTGEWCGWRSLTGTTVTPDGVSWAKGIANGFPLGAFWVRRREVNGRGALCDLLGPGSHGTTYGGNPVACAAGLAVLDEIEEKDLLRHALECGAYFREELRRMQSPLVAEVRAIGLMLGLEVVSDFKDRMGIINADTASIALTKQLMDEGLLVVPAGERTVRFLPPLNVTREELREAAGVLRRVLGG
jgi:acetylornithine/N-succinyldiaminopimelate aminotransferase